MGWYWSNCANQPNWGLEIGGIAAIDIDNHTAFHLEAFQTLNAGEQNLTDCYTGEIVDRKDTLRTISKCLVADAWFANKPFNNKVIALEMHLISRLRDDADLRYLCTDKPTGKKVRLRQFTGKITIMDIDKEYFTLISQDEESTVYAAEVYSKVLKRIIMLVYVTYEKTEGKDARKLYLSTDVSMNPAEILLY